MRIKERDELLTRLDERTANIWALTEKQESHLSKLNDSMVKHAVRISCNETSIKWIIRVLAAAGILGGSAAGVIQCLR